MTKRLAAALTLLVVAAANPLLHSAARQDRHEVRRITPRDDSAADPEFMSFKARLLTAARTGDVSTLVGLTAADVRVNSETSSPEKALASFGVSPGQPWRALRAALELGVHRARDEFVAPFTGPLMAGLDDAVVVRRGARLRAAPNANAPVVRTLAIWDVVALDRSHAYDVDLVNGSDVPAGPSAWARVRTAGGDAGYVFGKLLVTADSPSFVFGRVDGAWRLTAIVVGE